MECGSREILMAVLLSTTHAVRCLSYVTSQHPQVLVSKEHAAVKSSWLEIPLPRGPFDCVKSAVLHVSLARLATIHARGWSADSSNARVRLASRQARGQT
jgi:hypothetical protein